MQVGDETPIHRFSEIWLEASDFLNLSCNYKLILASLLWSVQHLYAYTAAWSVANGHIQGLDQGGPG